jgi:hypothetical protein
VLAARLEDSEAHSNAMRGSFGGGDTARAARVKTLFEGDHPRAMLTNLE